ncbi:MAG: phosphate/phosphite/phosphonate ABC transporter substrate-binding protein [Gammaproteobacteria bacterium]|nr:phosphate/phosphite/phosphonate ABC transporter substrate-binding protein [Gammaproteobacteria bacterium]
MSLLVIPSQGVASGANNKQYEVGIFPHLQKNYQPVVENLSKSIDHKVHFSTDESIENFYEHLKKEYYDIVVAQPFEYVILSKKYGYIPLATKKQPIKALIVAKKGGAIQNIQNLLGRKLLLPPNSTVTSYLTKKHLHNFGFDLNHDISIRYERTHVSCLQKLLLGFADACATRQATLDFFERRMEMKFQVISQTPEIPDILFAAHPRVDAAHRKILTKALFQWGDTKEAKKLLSNKSLTSFRPITDKRYDIVRKIKAEVDAY